MRTLTLRRSLASAVLLLGSACATGGSAGSEASPSSSRAVITLAELPTTGTETAYDAINRLRPEFLRRIRLSPTASSRVPASRAGMPRPRP
jgi:hypothetical protein